MRSWKRCHFQFIHSICITYSITYACMRAWICNKNFCNVIFICSSYNNIHKIYVLTFENLALHQNDWKLVFSCLFYFRNVETSTQIIQYLPHRIWIVKLVKFSRLYGVINNVFNLFAEPYTFFWKKTIRNERKNLLPNH